MTVLRLSRSGADQDGTDFREYQARRQASVVGMSSPQGPGRTCIVASVLA